MWGQHTQPHPFCIVCRLMMPDLQRWMLGQVTNPPSSPCIPRHLSVKPTLRPSDENSVFRYLPWKRAAISVSSVYPGVISGWATILPEPSKKLPTSRLNECLALLPRTGNYWFSRIRSVADSLINSDFADFTVLQVYTGSRSAFRHSRIAGPQAERIGDLDSPRIASMRDV
jgi:hypothetical protein